MGVMEGSTVWRLDITILIMSRTITITKTRTTATTNMPRLSEQWDISVGVVVLISRKLKPCSSFSTVVFLVTVMHHF